MHHFSYRSGVLHAEDVNLNTLAAEVGTPFYCYSTATLERHYRVFAGAFADVDALVCYAMKANSNQAVLKTFAKLGAGMDVVSEGELRRARAAALPGIRVSGVDMHIGSQITDLAPFDDAFTLLAEFVTLLRSDGHVIDHLDLGGGLGVPYRDDNEPPPHPDAYAAIIKNRTRHLDAKLVLEPGRLLVANAGILVTEVIYVKEGEGKTFVIVDAAMNDLIRPTLYEAYHAVWPVREPGPATPRIIADIVGPVCESGDYLALNRDLPVLRTGDLVAIMSAGAYGAVQAGTYNTRPLVPEVLVRNHTHAIIRPRPTYEEMIALDHVPAWL